VAPGGDARPQHPPVEAWWVRPPSRLAPARSPSSACDGMGGRVPRGRPLRRRRSGRRRAPSLPPGAGESWPWWPLPFAGLAAVERPRAWAPRQSRRARAPQSGLPPPRSPAMPSLRRPSAADVAAAWLTGSASLPPHPPPRPSGERRQGPPGLRFAPRPRPRSGTQVSRPLRSWTGSRRRRHGAGGAAPRRTPSPVALLRSHRRARSSVRQTFLRYRSSPRARASRRPRGSPLPGRRNGRGPSRLDGAVAAAAFWSPSPLPPVRRW
jgi:hypothetical protein